LDAPLPGIGPWDEITRSHALWHFSFWGPDAERLVKGRERFISIASERICGAIRRNSTKLAAHYAGLYAKPGAMHAAFEQFKAFDQDAADNKALVAKGPLTMPVLAIAANNRSIYDGGGHARGRDRVTSA